MSALRCGTCTQCCLNRPRYTLQVSEAEQAMFGYLTEVGPDGKLYLQQTELGDCIYADAQAGCRIHGWKPLRCVTWDCRRHERDHPSFRIRLCARLARERSDE